MVRETATKKTELKSPQEVPVGVIDNLYFTQNWQGSRVWGSRKRNYMEINQWDYQGLEEKNCMRGPNSKVENSRTKTS